MMLFHKNLRKIAEIIKYFVAKILKICLKKMYTLNRYGGNTEVQSNTQQCPSCHTAVQRNGGCNHMRCSVCNEHFCYVCGGRWAGRPQPFMRLEGG